MTDSVFDEMQQVLARQGADAALDRLIETLRAQKDYHQLFDALIVKKRYDMGLPLVPRGKLTDLPKDLQQPFEEAYVEACRLVGQLYLDAKNIPHAWLYLNTIGETQKVAEAIEALAPEEASEEVIEVAFHRGAHPRKGFEFILNRYGTCSAITVFEQLGQVAPEVREPCARLLVRRLHADLLESLKRDIARREGGAPETSRIADLLEGRGWLFDDMNYHVDTSHLASVVRFSRLLTDKQDLALALELAEYGRHLSAQFQFPGEAPFEKLYEDHRIYLRGLIGQDGEEAMRHFRAKLASAEGEGAAQLSAEVLAGLLARLGRYDEAVRVWVDHLQGDPSGRDGCPTLAELCRLAGDFRGLMEASRRQGDLVNFAAAMVEEQKAGR